MFEILGEFILKFETKRLYLRGKIMKKIYLEKRKITYFFIFSPILFIIYSIPIMMLTFLIAYMVLSNSPQTLNSPETSEYSVVFVDNHMPFHQLETLPINIALISPVFFYIIVKIITRKKEKDERITNFAKMWLIGEISFVLWSCLNIVMLIIMIICYIISFIVAPKEEKNEEIIEEEK